jgi:FixJ family two-component response regulator
MSQQVTNRFIAIVDDDEALCASLVDLMRSVGYRAEPFTSGEALLVSSELSLFDCVIADVHLPGVSGITLLGKLKDRGCMIPVILITALSDAKLDREANLRGAKCLFRKPFDTKALLDSVERILTNERDST